MEFHEIAELKIKENSTYRGKNDNGEYRIWPSAKHRGYFYFDRIVYPTNNQICMAESSKRPMKKEGIAWLVNKYAKDTIWEEVTWDGKEFNFFDVIPKEKKTVVYFIRAVGTNFVKIGRGNRRLKDLQTACPFELVYLCEIETKGAGLETSLHKRFEKYHHRGEWYYLSDEIMVYIKENAK